jgi:hypothetical protein
LISPALGLSQWPAQSSPVTRPLTSCPYWQWPGAGHGHESPHVCSLVFRATVPVPAQPWGFIPRGRHLFCGQHLFHLDGGRYYRVCQRTLHAAPVILLEGINTLDEHHINMAEIFKAEHMAAYFRFPRIARLPFARCQLPYHHPIAWTALARRTCKNLSSTCAPNQPPLQFRPRHTVGGTRVGKRKRGCCHKVPSAVWVYYWR